MTRRWLIKRLWKKVSRNTTASAVASAAAAVDIITTTTTTTTTTATNATMQHDHHHHQHQQQHSHHNNKVSEDDKRNNKNSNKRLRCECLANYILGTKFHKFESYVNNASIKQINSVLTLSLTRFTHYFLDAFFFLVAEI